MKRRHTLVISILLGVAISAGAVALVRTAAGNAGETGQATPDSWVAERTAQLDRYEAELERTLTTQPAAGQADQVVYVQQPTTQAQPSESDDESELEDADDHEDENDDEFESEGGEDDD